MLAALLSGCLGGKRETGDLSDDPSADRTDPIVLFTAPASGETVSGVVAWSATASDDVGVADMALRVDGEKVEVDEAEPWEGSWDATAASNGAHTLEVVATDAAGNRGTNSIDVVVDNEGGLDPDAIVITNPTDGASLCGEVTVQTTVSDEVVSVVFSLNGATQETDTEAPFAWTWDTTTSPDTTYTISAKASNAEGSTAVDTVEVSVLNEDASCDNAPSVVFAEPLDGDVVRGTVDLSVSALDDNAVASVSFYVDSGTLVTDTSVPYQTALDTTIFSDGVHDLKAVATDSIGQTSSAEITFTVDNEAPVLVIDTPDDGDALAGTVAFTAEATDNLGLETVELAVDGTTLGDFVAGPYTVDLDTTALSRGDHTLSATATDLAGNETTEAIEVTVDNPPQVVFTEPTDTTLYGVASVVAHATDDERVVDTTLTQDGVTVDTSTGSTPVSTTIDTCDLAHGETIEVEAMATDPEGNEGSASLTLTVDQLLQVEIDSYTGALDETVTLGADVGDDQTISRVVWDLDGTTVGSATRSSGTVTACFDCGCKRFTTTWSTASATEGTHTLTVTATNSAGDTATASTTVTIDYDQDGDGYDSDFYGGDDCDDTDTSYHPGASEDCDGKDEDCDGTADDDFDVDGDGYLDEDDCAGLAKGTDCDDTDATIYEGATEVCDEQDNDCDGYVDNEDAWGTEVSSLGDRSEGILANGMYGNVYLATRNGTLTGFYGYITPNSTTATTSLTWAVYEASSSTGDYVMLDSNDTSISGHTSASYSAGTFDVTLHGGHYYLLAVTSHSSGGAMTRYGDKSPSFTSAGGLTLAGYIGGSSSATTFTTDPSTSQVFTQVVVTIVPSASDADADSDGITVGCGDCDDLDDTVAPDLTESCDGLDNDCDGTVDESCP